MDVLDIARWQFGIITVYHFLFVPLTIGLTAVIAGLETAWVRTGREDYLRLTKFFGKLFLINFAIGVVTGLVWTPVGGDIIFIEATKMPGGKGFMLTGQLGDVMKESARAALSYIRSESEHIGIPANFFNGIDIHLHVPAGAIPKDGPSAGIAMATALASLLTGRPVREEVAMTGEITLRGRVSAIGGLKEKLLAALRGGIKTVIIPDENRKDLADIPAAVTRHMKIVPVKWIDEVLDLALERPLPGRVAAGAMEQPALPAVDPPARPDVKH